MQDGPRERRCRSRGSLSVGGLPPGDAVRSVCGPVTAPLTLKWGTGSSGEVLSVSPWHTGHKSTGQDPEPRNARREARRGAGTARAPRVSPTSMGQEEAPRHPPKRVCLGGG